MSNVLDSLRLFSRSPITSWCCRVCCTVPLYHTQYLEHVSSNGMHGVHCAAMNGQVLWPALAEDHGWTKIQGPRTSDAYYFPEGIERGKNGAKCRVDFYDSFKQVSDSQGSTSRATPDEARN